MDIEIIGYIQNMAAGEILQHVPPETLLEIKKTDPNPRLEAYVIAHPGESKTTVIGLGTKILKWGAGVLRAIKDNIKIGTPVFNGHNADNSHKNRPAIGKIIAVIQNTQNEVINIIHRFKDWLHLEADVASFEAPPLRVAEGTELDGHEVQPYEMGPITGVVLAHSSTASPAFEGAVKLAALQCLNKENEMPITLKEVHDFIQEHKTSPLVLFKPEDILKLDIVTEETAKHKGSTNLYEQVQRLKLEVGDLKEKLDTQKTDYEGKLKEKNTEIIGYKGKEVFDTQVGKREKLTDQQKAWFQKKRDSLKLDPEKEIETQINTWMDSQLTEFDEFSKILIPEQTTDKDKNENLKPEGAPDDISEFRPD
jgi:hypothetical protein